MTKQVIIVSSSPRRNGNSAILAEQAAAGAHAGGAKVEIIYLHELTLAPCTACDACQNATESDCVINDDLTSLLPRVRQADALLIAGPVYWFTFAAQTKLFVDRVF
jgi:multimeric flavodoxin WrbA